MTKPNRQQMYIQNSKCPWRNLRS